MQDHQHSHRRKLLFNAEEETSRQLNSLLELSAGRLDESASSRLLRLRRDAEDKVHARLEQSNRDFLLILLKERGQKITQELPVLQQKLENRQRRVLAQLRQQSISIDRSRKSISAIKQELKDSLHLMRTNNPEKQVSQSELQQQKRREELRQQNYLEFRRQKYWKQPNQKSKSALQFLSSINHSQKKLRAKYDSLQEESQKRREAQLSQVKQQEEETHRRARKEVHDRYQQYRQQRQKDQQAQARKQREAEEFLSKYRQKVPAHVVFSEREKQQSLEEERRMKHALEDYRAKKRGYSLSQITNSLREYEEYKEMRAQDLEQRRMMELSEEQRIRSQLDCLYKSRTRAISAEQEQPGRKEASQQKAVKMMIYSSKVKESFKPQVDAHKRQQLLQEIADARKKEHKIVKVRDGQLILLDKDQLKPREIGLQYLQEVKQMTSQIERKPAALAAPEGTKLKDRSLQPKKIDKKPFTITNWRQILQSERLTPAEKEEQLQRYFQLVEEEQQRWQSGQRVCGPVRSIELQGKSDHYQLQKAAAKLALLKSLG